ncbi:uncharacterized protein [Drosophila virilis]|uniref:Uncharacterized protein n=1 Tax=Drosophila virilis TaxID=7244 RepID=B4LDJ0_DROVI|nr:uncharacterized protein LOC6624075 [Drosophila virilis]EDW68928.1 uncharacterized protein Dvir_GJ12960 [Drosophila virilis]
MKKRQRITGHAAGTPKTTTFATCCLCFRVTSATARVERLHLLGSWLPLPLLALAIFSTFAGCSAIGYSYTRFEGPVAGPERLVAVPDAYGGGTHSDYVARPEYSFAYGIEDGQTRVLQNRKETRNGDEVRGVYSVVDPDGTLRVVKYTADDTNGFQAEVITNGVATLHGHGSDAGGVHVQQQVEHDQANEVQGEEDDGDNSAGTQQQGEEAEEDAEEEAEPLPAAPQKGKGQYKVHEDHDEDDEGENEDNENEGGGDHEEYEGSSEEGYEDANTHSQQQLEDTDSSEEY